MEFFENFGLHEMVIGTAVLLGIYSGIVIIRLARMSRPRAPEPVWKQPPTQFGEQVLKTGIEAELAELRGEVAALKDEVILLHYRTAFQFDDCVERGDLFHSEQFLCKLKKN